jgi:5'-3' exonuclease
MLNKLLRETNAGEAPTHLAVVFDKSERSFRTAMYPQYKAQRPPAPDDLIPQFALIRQAVAAFKVACVEQDTYEADDLIATYARQAVEAGAKVRIVSSDKDLMQLVVDDVVVLYDTMKDCKIGEQEVIEKFGVPPAKMIDVQALAGDAVDNVPGVPGIGVKTGAQLIQQYGDLETLLASAHEIKQPKRRENLIAYADAARLSRELVRLRDDVPLEHPLETIGVRPPDPKALVGFLKAMEFTTLTRRIAAEVGVEMADVEPLQRQIVGWPPETGEAVPPASTGWPRRAPPMRPRRRPSNRRPKTGSRHRSTTTPMSPSPKWPTSSAGSRRPASRAMSRSTPKPTRSTRSGPNSSASRSPWSRAWPATFRSGTGRRTASTSRQCAGAVAGRGRARRAETPARGPRDPEDRPQHEVRSAAVRPPRHHRCPRSTTPASSPMRSNPASPPTT